MKSPIKRALHYIFQHLGWCQAGSVAKVVALPAAFVVAAVAAASVDH